MNANKSIGRKTNELETNPHRPMHGDIYLTIRFRGLFLLHLLGSDHLALLVEVWANLGCIGCREYIWSDRKELTKLTPNNL
jgi:hypothetical protein